MSQAGAARAVGCQKGERARGSGHRRLVAVVEGGAGVSNV